MSFKPSLMFVVKVSKLLMIGAPERLHSTLLTNIRQAASWKDLPGTKTNLLPTFVIYNYKKLLNIRPRVQILTVFICNVNWS